MPFRVETGHSVNHMYFGYLEMFGLLRLCIFGDVWVYIYVMCVHVYCIQVNYFKTVVPFRRSANRTFHCYSELSVGY